MSDPENLVRQPDSENDVKGVSRDYFAGMVEGRRQERQRIVKMLRESGYPESFIKFFAGETE